MNRKREEIVHPAKIRALNPEEKPKKEEKKGKELCEEIAHSSARDVSQKCKVEEAVKKGDYETVARLLKQVTRITESDDDILKNAIKFGNTDIVEILLKYGADANGIVLGDVTRRMIHLAASYMQPESVKSLIKYGADVNDKRSKFDRTPIFWAFTSPERDAECPWVERYVETNIIAYCLRKPPDGQEPLKFEKLYDTIHTLLEYGANLNVVDTTGKVALEFCVSDYSPYNTGIFFPTTQLMVKYLSLEKIVTNHVESKNLEVMSQPDSMFLRSCYEEGLREITAMKCTFISSNVTFYDILTRDAKYLVRVIKCKDIREIFQSDAYIKRFSIYVEFLKKQFEKGCDRKKLIDSSIRPLGYLINHIVPDNIIEEILHELDECDLDKIIDAYEGV